MSQTFPSQYPGPYEPPHASHRGGSKLWLWLLLGGGLMAVIVCAGVIGALMYMGSVGPETSVYTGNQVPKRYVETMKSVGALEQGETILYFYSDAMTDIRNGFYFVSDRKVAIYAQDAAGEPLTVVRFDEIEDLDISRTDTFFEDSVITIELKDGRPVSFPVSGEADGDQRFFEAIQNRMGPVGEGQKAS